MTTGCISPVLPYPLEFSVDVQFEDVFRAFKDGCVVVASCLKDAAFRV